MASLETCDDVQIGALGLSESQPPDIVDNPNLDIVFERTVHLTPLTHKPLKKDMLGFEYAEHSYIGDAIYLTLAGGRKVPAIDHKLTLKNGLVVTYGQINGLAGDFYGTTKPISDGQNAQEQSTRFVEAYNTLAEPSPRQPKEAQDILGVLQAEVKAVNDALRHHEDPSQAYSKLPDVSLRLQRLTQFRPSGFPSYLGLARINWDHFGLDARTAYNAGHATALQAAISGDLEKAYMLNAFADHFLEDSFSAGHLRTPRRGLHGRLNIAHDACAKFMHDEDCAIGLTVKNPAGESWTCYGDKRSLDEDDSDNLKRCIAAVQASADEIYKAFSAKRAPSSSDYKAWALAPTLASARDINQELSALFRYTDADEKAIERRAVIEDRRAREYTMSWQAMTTLLKCKTDGWWKFPITIDGPRKIMPWTSFAVTTPRDRHSRVYYQNPPGGVLESVHIEGQWSGGVESPPALLNAAPFTPLAAISRDNGRKVHLYYLSEEYKLREYCCTNGRWSDGALNDLDVDAAPNTSIAALAFELGGNYHIRVYCQESGSDQIKEFRNDDFWARGAVLMSALSGTSISAVHNDNNNDEVDIRVYYQTHELAIRECCVKDEEWVDGEFHGDPAPGKTQIGALISSWRGVEFGVFWMNTDNEVVHGARAVDGNWHTRKVMGPLKSGTRFALAQWKGGKSMRLYYQSADHSVLEMCKEAEGEWRAGVTVGKA